jgi:hypothetical protein
MTQQILLKRSSVPARVPTTVQLALGELGVNTYDGKLYLSKNNGTASVVEIGAATLTGDVTGTISGQAGTLTLAASGAVAGTYGSAAQIPQFTVDAKGRIVSVTNVAVSFGSGIVLQSQTSVIAAQSGNTLLAISNSTPTTSTAGTAIWSQVITPNATASRINISGSFTFDHNQSGRQLNASLFRGTTCIGVFCNTCWQSGQPVPMTFTINDAPSTVSAVTYTLYVGASASGTWYVNQGKNAMFNGMLARNGITVQEFS